MRAALTANPDVVRTQMHNIFWLYICKAGLHFVLSCQFFCHAPKVHHLVENRIASPKKN